MKIPLDDMSWNVLLTESVDSNHHFWLIFFLCDNCYIPFASRIAYHAHWPIIRDWAAELFGVLEKIILRSDILYKCDVGPVKVD